MGLLQTSGDGTDGDVFGLLLSNGGVLPVKDSPSGAAASIHAWLYDAAIPAGVVNPELGQAPAAAGGGQSVKVFAQDAFAGSGAAGGTFVFWNGANDGTPAPPRFTIKQATAPNQAAGVVMVEAFFNPSTLVQSVGFGDSGAGLAGTQVVLQGAGNSVVAHGTIGMFALDNATTGQSFLQFHDVDGSGLLPGALNAQYDVFTAAAEPDTGLYLQRNAHTVGSGGSRYIDVQNNTTFPVPAPVRRFDVQEIASTGGGTQSQANLAFYSPTGTTAHQKSFVKIPFGDGGGNPGQGIIVQRDAGDANDLIIIRRTVGILFWGDQSDPAQQRFEAFSSTLHENVDTTAGAAGWAFDNASLGQCFKVASEAHKPVRFGGVDNGHDGQQKSIYDFNGSGVGTPFVLASIVLTDNAVTELSVSVVARDSVATSDFMAADIKSAFAKVAGVITSPTAAGVPVDVGHTAAAAGTAATVAFVVNAGAVEVHVTNWSANVVHYVVFPTEKVNVGLA